MTFTNAIFDVLLPLPLADSFEYRGDPTKIAPGMLVEVPFGQRRMTGLVLRLGSGKVAPEKLKTIGNPSPLPPLSESFRQFLLWAAAYNMTPPGLLLKMTLAGTNSPQLPAGESIWRVGASLGGKITPKRQEMLSLLTQYGDVTAEQIAAAGISPAVVNAMTKAGMLEKIEKPFVHHCPQPNPDHHTPGLSPEQVVAAIKLRDSVEHPAPLPILLEGVTGSGKTEVYAEAIAANLRSGRQSLILMPEIALTTAMLDRFAARFGAQPVVWHSDLPDRQRRINWWAIAQGEAKIIVGARSALFLPYANLGLIVVDEEHEAAYKQEEGVTYHARDMAVARAYHGKFAIVLASATPALESHVNAAQGRYQRVLLPQRFGGAAMPHIHLIDMRTEGLPKTRWLSAPLVSALQETLQAGEQAMLFLNRRGYAPLTLCRSCGHRLQCPQCSAWLVAHKQAKKLQCHHCGHVAALPEHCPACQAVGKFASCGPGVERIADEAATIFGSARIGIMSSDLLQNPKDITALLDDVHNRKIDILIGTQIMAKGYHFPEMTLVGIVDADLGLSGGDPRAAERSFQLLQQVAGRTGRASKAGRAYLQTFQPEHPVMQALASGRRADFIAAELRERETYALPPYRRLAALILSGSDAQKVDRVAATISKYAPQDDRLRLLGPAPAPLALLRGQYRRRLLLIATKEINVQAMMHTWLAQINLPKDLKLQIDIDPYSFY
ncbi:MAG: primosomal protein N' [Alphaproteobacteria bacterium]